MKIKAAFIALIIAFMFSYACSQNQSGHTEGEIVKKLTTEEKDTVDLVFNRNGKVNQKSIGSNSIFIPKGNSISIDGVIDDEEWSSSSKYKLYGGDSLFFMNYEDTLFIAIRGKSGGFSS
ncbi:hypothetical protein KAR48_05310 [bacterium]|nr:hypothetical protein [bacterium]